MSEKPTLSTGPAISQDQLDAISGGGCSAQELVDISAQLKSAYENLIDLTSYVIERVVGNPPTP